MKTAIKILTESLKIKEFDLKMNKKLIKDKSNSEKLKLYYQDCIFKNQKIISELKQAIQRLKEPKWIYKN